jgi:hypothetical protein
MHAGDFWDRRGDLPVVPLNKVQQELSSWQVPLLLLPGNHDQVGGPALLCFQQLLTIPAMEHNLLLAAGEAANCFGVTAGQVLAFCVNFRSNTSGVTVLCMKMTARLSSQRQANGKFLALRPACMLSSPGRTCWCGHLGSVQHQVLLAAGGSSKRQSLPSAGLPCALPEHACMTMVARLTVNE